MKQDLHLVTLIGQDYLLITEDNKEVVLRMDPFESIQINSGEDAGKNQFNIEYENQTIGAVTVSNNDQKKLQEENLNIELINNKPQFKHFSKAQLASFNGPQLNDVFQMTPLILGLDSQPCEFQRFTTNNQYLFVVCSSQEVNIYTYMYDFKQKKVHMMLHSQMEESLESVEDMKVFFNQIIVVKTKGGEVKWVNWENTKNRFRTLNLEEQKLDPKLCSLVSHGLKCVYKGGVAFV